MSIIEIQDAADARTRLRDLYGITGDDAGPYVDMLGLLCGWSTHPSFEKNLEIISSMLWREYNAPGMASRPNRFTRSIINLANRKFGFVTQDNVVFAGPLNGQTFGQHVRGRVLWKDSFALGHGEFSHSYQWLTAGFAFGWNEATGDIYSRTAGKMSRVPLFVKDNDGIAYRRSPLWEWLVDCTRHQNWFDAPNFHVAAVNEWVSKRPATEPKLQPQDLGARPVTYPRANALTKTTFRSANNVATLARSRSDWFISFYEMHRTAKLQAAQAAGQEMLQQFDVASMKTSGKLIPPGEKAYLGAKGIERGEEHEDEYRARVDAKAIRARSHPIEGIKAERAFHYGLEKPSQGEEWSSPAKFVHNKPINPNVRLPAAKQQVQIKLHGLEGSLNRNVRGLVV